MKYVVPLSDEQVKNITGTGVNHRRFFAPPSRFQLLSVFPPPVIAPHATRRHAPPAPSCSSIRQPRSSAMCELIFVVVVSHSALGLCLPLAPPLLPPSVVPVCLIPKCLMRVYLVCEWVPLGRGQDSGCLSSRVKRFARGSTFVGPSVPINIMTNAFFFWVVCGLKKKKVVF